MVWCLGVSFGEHQRPHVDFMRLFRGSGVEFELCSAGCRAWGVRCSEGVCCGGQA